MSVAGIDFSSRAVHVVLLDDDTDQASPHVYELHGPTPFERARSLRRSFPTRSFWEDHGVYLVAIEDPHSRANHTAKALGLAAGAIAALLPNALTVIQTPPAEWKRVFTGSPTATKDLVSLHVSAIWADAPHDMTHDTSDAYAIAWAARRINQQAIEKASVTA